MFYKLALCENPDKVIMRVNGVHLKSYHTPNSSPSPHPQSTSPFISRSRSSSFPFPRLTLSLSLFPDLVLFPFPALVVSHILHLDLYQDLDLFPDPALMAIPDLHLDLFLVLCQNLHCYHRFPPIVHQMSLYYLFLYLCHPTTNGLNGI